MNYLKSMMNRIQSTIVTTTTILFAMMLILGSSSSPPSWSVNGQSVFQQLDCPGKIKEACSGFRMDPLPTDPEDSRLRVTCCSSAAVARCIRQTAARECPSIPIDSIMNMVQLVATNTGCAGYDFWTPECLYTNFMIEVLGAGAGVGLILLALIVLCCCCCCRKKQPAE